MKSATPTRASPAPSTPPRRACAPSWSRPARGRRPDRRASARRSRPLGLRRGRPDAARLLAAEPWARGAAGRERREALVEHFVALLSRGREELAGGEEPPAVTEQVLIGALASILERHLLAERAPLARLAPGLIEFVLLPYLGRARARAWGRRRALDRDASLHGPGRRADQVAFTEVLARLQAMIGARVQVVFNLRKGFFDCGFHARLDRVESLLGGEGPVLLVSRRAENG